MKAVVLAAGEGKRTRPFTYTKSKCALPIGNKPLLERLITALCRCKVEEVLIIVGHMKEQIMRYFGDGSKFKMKLEYVAQERLSGTAKAVGLARDYVKDEPFLTLCGDTLLDPKAIEAVISHYDEAYSAVMAVVPVKEPEQYGVVKLKKSRVIDVIEKPKTAPPGSLANASIYVFSKDIFTMIEKTEPSPRGEFEITDSIRRLLKNRLIVEAVKIDSKWWLDVGRPWDLLEANKRVLEKEDLKIKGDVEIGARIIGSVGVGEGTIVRSGSYIQGPTIIGNDSDIGPNCFIRPYTSIGNEVRIGNACEIKNSIIMDRTNVAHLSYVADSVIGSGCNFGAGTITANLRFDDSTVKMRVEGEVMDTGLIKLGAMIGDGVKTGVGTLLMPGVKIGPRSWIGPNVIVRVDVEPDTIIMPKQELESEKKRE